jgi:hypothetical protein
MALNQFNVVRDETRRFSISLTLLYYDVVVVAKFLFKKKKKYCNILIE